MKILKYILFFYIVIILGSCHKTYDLNQIPQIPSVNSIILYSYFFDNDTVGISEQSDYFNWNNTYIKLSKWNDLIQNNVAIPYTAYQLVSNYKSQHYSNTTWLWNYNFNKDSSVYDVSLYGTFEIDSSSLWEMFISTDGNSPNILLKGTSNYDLTIGKWILSKYVYIQINVLEIEWLKTEQFFIVKYTNIYQQSDFLGSTLTFYYPLQKNKNTYIKIYNARNKSFTDIEIFPNQKSGRIKHFVTYEDTVWHCWDSTFVNTNCY